MAPDRGRIRISPSILENPEELHRGHSGHLHGHRERATYGDEPVVVGLAEQGDAQPVEEESTQRPEHNAPEDPLWALGKSHPGVSATRLTIGDLNGGDGRPVSMEESQRPSTPP